jgi:proton glutamate symport protein
MAVIIRKIGRIPLTSWILISMVVGVLIGVVNPVFAVSLSPLSTMFLRMISSIIVPLIFCTLVVGIAGHGDDMKRVGRLALKSIVYFEIVTSLALVIGLVAVNLVRPGDGVSLAASTDKVKDLAKNAPTGTSFLEHLVPKSFFEAATNNEVLQIVFFAVIFAVALSKVQGRSKEIVLGMCEGVADVMFKFTMMVMRFAPFGIGAAIAVAVGKSGVGVLLNLGQLVLTLYGALVVFFLLVLLPVALLFRVPLRRFLRAVRSPALIAFSTTSSEAALPLAMQSMEAIGVPRRIVAFVMPTGYSFNLDGSTLYLAVASIFVAQASNHPMALKDQLVMMLALMITSKGVAAVPRASLVILAGTLATFKLPLEGVAIILGVDALMDMARTSTNLIGNCLATVVMARWEGEFSEPQPEVLLAQEGLLPIESAPQGPRTSGAAPAAS